jgi:hypothetical protein
VQPGLTVVRPGAAARRIGDALARLDAVQPPGAPLAVILAWLAAGRFERVRALIVAAPGSASLPLAVARYVAWTGDLATAAGAWSRVHAATDALFAPDRSVMPGDAWLRAPTADELQRTAADVGDPALAAMLHRHARAAPTDMTLPDDTPVAARVVLDFVHDELGLLPDATRHRLRLRPRLIAPDPRLDVRGIRFADGSVELDATAADSEGGRSIVVRVDQESGAIPITLLLEPVVRGSVIATLVDGRPAELAPRPVAAGTVVPVQLVLDAARRLRIDVTSAPG